MLGSKIEGRAALLAGLGLALFVPLFMAVLPAAGLDSDGFNQPATLDAFVRHHFLVFSLPFVDGLLLHLAGLVTVLAVHRRWADRSPWLLAATIGGVAWMVLDIAQNGLGLYASHEIVRHAAASVSGPQLVLIGQVTTGLRLAGHVFGGLWVLVVSGIALRHGGLPRTAARIGIVSGALMSVNVLVPPTQLPLFALLPVWFALVGRHLLVSERAMVSA